MIKKIFYFKSLIVGFSLALFFVSFTNSDKTMVRVPGGILHTEDPVTKAPKSVTLKPFLLDKNLVTVADFELFVKATGYKTEAETFGNAGVFDSKAKGWTLLDGADFRYPLGRSKPKAEPNHPVTQVSWNDAKAYATWKGKRLPTQWEWEFAAKNASSTQQLYSWGDNLIVEGKYKANTWQGTFPSYNTIEDGFEYTSPVGYFGANALGLTDMGGNVWQWCDDWIAPTAREAQIDPAMRKVTRGGSFLCDPMVCHGYTVHGRSASTPESSMVHIGFRCAKDI
jgi:sulfatase modifying factor 1